MKEDFFVIALVILGALILLFANTKVIKKFNVKEKEETNLIDLVEEAIENGEAEGIVSYPEDVCLDLLINFNYPCKNEKGVFAKSPYCFEANKVYKIKVKRNNEGGVCIEAEEQ